MLMGLAAPVLGRARAGVVAFALLCGLATLVLPWESQWVWQSARQLSQSVPHSRADSPLANAVAAVRAVDTPETPSRLPWPAALADTDPPRPPALRDGGCFWLMMAGDSNIRNLHGSLLTVLEASSRETYHAHNYSEAPPRMPHCTAGLNENPKGVCDSRWADRDVLLAFGGFCLRVSLRFLANQKEVSRLSKDGWDGNAYPVHGQETKHPLAARAAHGASQPHVLWFSHGLWRLPQPFGTCAARFVAEQSRLQKWQKAGTRVVWQGQPCVRSAPPHPNATYTKQDTVCAKAVARKAGVAFFDAWEYTHSTEADAERHRPVFNNDVHMKTFALHGVRDGVLLPAVFADVAAWLAATGASSEEDWAGMRERLLRKLGVPNPKRAAAQTAGAPGALRRTSFGLQSL